MTTPITHKELTAQIYNVRVWIAETDTTVLKQLGDQLLKQTQFTVLNFVEHYFPVKGYTALWLLAESHLAIHTFPEAGNSYIELSGCNGTKTKAFYNLLAQSELNIRFEQNEFNGVPFTPET